MLGIFDKIYSQLLIWTKMLQRSLLVARFLHLRRPEKMFFFPTTGEKSTTSQASPVFSAQKRGQNPPGGCQRPLQWVISPVDQLHNPREVQGGGALDQRRSREDVEKLLDSRPSARHVLRCSAVSGEEIKGSWTKKWGSMMIDDDLCT